MVNDTGSGRYLKVPKADLIRTCLSSLVDSINRVTDHDIQLAVLDDHSTPDVIADIQCILEQCRATAEFISVEDGTGNGHTMGRVYDLVETYATDLWYHVEDDYLHRPEAITDILDSVEIFEKGTNKLVAINPHDDVWRYRYEIYASFIIHGQYRHYRTVKHTTYTCLASRALYDKYRSYFQDLVKLTTQRADYVENKTINKVWEQDDVALFSPIPGLAFHIMDASGKDPYIDIEGVYDSIPKLWKAKDRPKMAVVSMFNDAHKQLADHTWPNKVAYAEKHGYLSFAKIDGWNIKPIHFEKITHMLYVMAEHPDVDWVWWLDNDAVITNPDIELESIVDPDYHIIITTDIASINAGSFIVRNSIQGRDWLQFILDKGLEHYRDNRWPEQQPMTDFYVTFKDIIKIVPQRTMNSYNYDIYGVDPTDLLGTNGQWQPGDFVMHMPAIPNAARIDMIKQLTQESK